MTQNTYGDIPENLPTKKFFPLGEHLWNIYKENGWEFFKRIFTEITDPTYVEGLAIATNEKFQTAVDTAKKVLDGTISSEKAAKIISTWFFPPLLYIRSDLQTGTSKLIYGNSTDITFIVSNDVMNEVELIINAHMEDGIPIDYYYIHKNNESEIFNRRHIKLGYKLSDIPKKSKNSTQSGKRLIEIMRDIRNERSPQWADSDYALCMVWVSGGINVSCELSNFSALATVWDGIQAEKVYGLHDSWFTYVPYPSLLGMLVLKGRAGWAGTLSGLLMDNHLFINAFEPKLKKHYKTATPEIWDYLIRTTKEKGIPTPRQTLDCKLPDLKKKKTIKNEDFGWKYDNTARIKPFEWGLTEDEVFGGILTDITIDTPVKKSYGKEHIISMGIGE